MAKLIEFPNRMDAGGRNQTHDDNELEATIVAYLADGPQRLGRRIFGEGVQRVEDLTRLEQFFYSHLIARFRRVSEAFLSYLYLSRLATRDDLGPGYVSDLMTQGAAPARIGDFCFALAALYPEWVERRKSAMRVADYAQIGSAAYATAARLAVPPRDRVFRDIAARFTDYARAMYEARRALAG